MSHPVPRSRWRFVRRAIVVLAAAYVATTAAMLALEDRLLYHPLRADQRWDGPPPGVASEDVALHSSDGTPIDARWLPLPGAVGAVLVCHSRAGNLSHALKPHELAGWRELGFSVLVFDYPGFGRSGGRPTEAGCYAAADAACDWLTRPGGVPPEAVLLYGRSLGTAVAADLASRRLHRALVLVSPFTSIPDAAQVQFPLLPTGLARNRFDILAKVPRCGRPTLVVHGTRDGLVPFAHGERVFAAIPAPKRFRAVEGADHGDSVLAGFFPTLRAFLAETADATVNPVP
jgi:pimeloyl-ACP methyl ester carboxylesterase